MPLYGKQTQSALKNFPVSGWPVSLSVIHALALIKEHSAMVNGKLKKIPAQHASAIAKAAQSVQKGKQDTQFPVDVFQTGSGTSTNMNVNEVIASLASTRSRTVHPNDHVNAGQSTNDVFPSAVSIACAQNVRDELLPALLTLKIQLLRKAKQFHPDIKTGRTHLMDAVPVRLGDEFAAYAASIDLAIEQLKLAQKQLCSIPLGGTAVGTGLNTHPQFAKKVIARLSKATKLPLKASKNRMASQSLPLQFLVLSSALREVATVLTKIANDLRLMGSGPATGFSELILPELQPGSSIMPGKVNPVLCESVMQVAQYVTGADTTVHAALTGGSALELNTALPIIAQSLIVPIHLLSNVTNVFAKNCVAGLKVDRKTINERTTRNTMLVTALAPHIGYESAVKIAKEAFEKGETIFTVACKRTDIPKRTLIKLLDPSRMA